MNLAGVFAPVPTPFDDHDRVDTARLRAMLAKMVSRPLDGVGVTRNAWGRGTLRATAADAAPCAFAPRGQATSRSAIGQAGNIVRLVLLVRPRSRAAAPFVGRDPFSARFVPTPLFDKT